MILFLNDWLKYPTAIIDVTTRNRSFVRLASVYREMGVKNNAFILALINPDLRNVDPFDPELTQLEMSLIATECAINPWYFFREVIRVPAAAGTVTPMLQANRGNIALFWSFFNHIWVILIQPRQTGKSLNSDILDCFLLNLGCQNTQINLLTKDDGLRTANLERIREIMELMPRYLQQRTKADSNNSERITIGKLGNEYRAHVPQMSAKAADKVGRGLTSPIFKIDEGPFQPNIQIAMDAALAAGGAAVEAAEAAGSHYGTVMTTTAGKLNDPDGMHVYSLLTNSAVWTEHFFDASGPLELREMVESAGRGHYRVNCTFNHRQLGKTDEWLLRKIKDSGQGQEAADRDFFNRWTTGTSTNPVDVMLLNRMSASISNDYYTYVSSPYGFITQWYIPKEEIVNRMDNGRFVMALDTSEASGGDDTYLLIMDVDTMETIATGRFNKMNLFTFTKWLTQFLVEFKTVTCIIERRSTGAMILDQLWITLDEAGEDPFRRLYNTVVQNGTQYSDDFKQVSVPMGRRSNELYIRFKTTFGFATSANGATSRSELYSSTLHQATSLACDVARDETLVNQVGSLIKKNGRVDHPTGGHDDAVIAWLLATWLITMGRNLSFYGIHNVMRSVRKDVNPTSVRAIDEYQEQLRARMQELYNEMMRESDDFISMRIEHELRRLDKQVVLQEGEVYSINEMIKQVKDNRRKRITGNNLSSSSYANSLLATNQASHSARPMNYYDFQH